MVRYDPTIYNGAAVHYRYGRPAYSLGLEALLAEELGLDGGGRLLDVACGPGVLTVRLARLFGEAVGLDEDGFDGLSETVVSRSRFPPYCRGSGSQPISGKP